MNPEVLISEVGPRDGLQSVQATMPSEHKLHWLHALHAASSPASRQHEYWRPRTAGYRLHSRCWTRPDGSG
jgi:hypothetical protein